MWTRSLALGLTAMAVLFSRPAQAASIAVNATTTRTGNGCSFEEALRSVNQGSAFDACTVAGSGAINLVTIPNNSAVYVASGRNVAVQRTVTVRGGSRSGTILEFAGGDGDAGFSISGGSSVSVTFENLTVRGAAGNQLGGLTNLNASVALNNVRLTGFAYAGARNVLGTLRVTGSLIDLNGNGGSLPLGGGLGNDGLLIVDRSTITGNVGVLGGGIYSSAELEINDSTISGNEAFENGGGVFASNLATVTRTALEANFAGGLGGGLASDGGGTQITVRDSRVSDNAAFTGGGISVPQGAFLYSSRTLFAGNDAVDEGGGIFCGGQVGELENATVSGNRAARGGGIFHVGDSGEFHMTFTTVAKNTADERGGGLHVAFANPIFSGNLVGKNTAPSSPDVYSTTLREVGSSNLIQNNSGAEAALPAGPNIVGVDPMISETLENRGGLNRVHRLLPNSPAIDAIATHGQPPATDARGANFPRPRNGTDGANPARNGYDIGSFEQNPYQWEAESLSVVANTASYATAADGNASGNTVGNLKATSANQSVTYRTPTIPTGTYTVVVRVKKAANAGIFQTAMSNSQSGTYTSVGSAQDTYASTATWTELVVGTINVGSSGQKYVRLTATAKNASSSSFQLFPDSILLR
jgi:hypothetical protein